MQAPHPDRGWTKIGNGLKIQAVCRDDGAITALRVTCASPAEAKLITELLDEPGLGVEVLVGDSAYDTQALRERVADAGSLLVTTNDWPGRKRSLDPPDLRAAAKRERWVIERVFAWLKNWRAVATCHCRSAATYLVGLSLAVATINHPRA